MMENLSKYKGRQQAYIKHRLLETYLYKLFMIIGQRQGRMWDAVPAPAAVISTAFCP